MEVVLRDGVAFADLAAVTPDMDRAMLLVGRIVVAPRPEVEAWQAAGLVETVAAQDARRWRDAEQARILAARHAREEQAGRDQLLAERRAAGSRRARRGWMTRRARAAERESAPIARTWGGPLQGWRPGYGWPGSIGLLVTVEAPRG